MSSKIGYFLMNKAAYGRDWSADENSYRAAHIKRLQPGAMLFLDDDGKALETKRDIPDCAVVGRLYSDSAKEGDFWKVLTPQQCFDRYKDTPKGIIRNILNEPSGDVENLNKIATWCAEVMDLFGNAGIPIVTPNWGEGNPQLDHFDLLEPLWKAFDKWHDLHYYGAHEYGSHLGLLYNVSGSFDMYPWRIGRFELFTVPYLQAHGHKIPNVIVTEFGCDSAHDGSSFRGWTTCWNEQQYFLEMKQAVDVIYKAPHYKGLCIFSWGNTGWPNTESDWTTFDVSAATGLHKSLETLNNTPPPAPFDYGTMTRAQLQITGISYINLRSSPGTTGDILKQLHGSDEIEISENSLESGDYSWYKVISAGVTGYVADTAKWRITPIPDNTPEPPKLATVTIRIKGLSVEAAKELINNVEITIE